MIKVLIVDDSATERDLLKHILESEQDIEVVACAKNGKEAIELNARLKPDLITMDIEMPIMNGLEATRIIMSENPIPIVIISGKLNDVDSDAAFQALEAGAVSLIAKPINIAAGFETIKRNIIDIVHSMSEIKVITRRFNKKISIEHKEKKITSAVYEIVAIGASVGGPQALKLIFSQLPPDFPLPIVVVQHMTKGFMTGFTTWLNNHTQFTVKDAVHHELLKKGVIYFAADDHHLTIERKEEGLRAVLMSGSSVSGFCPSITVLLQSVATVCGKNAIGILLTGMGHDGAQGLLELKKSQGHTIIQDEKSAVVFGMGGVAQSLGAVDRVVELDNIANYLANIVK
jgi:two-component system chemotaxis response regulator CheB